MRKGVDPYLKLSLNSANLINKLHLHPYNIQ